MSALFGSPPSASKTMLPLSESARLCSTPVSAPQRSGAVVAVSTIQPSGAIGSRGFSQLGEADEIREEHGHIRQPVRDDLVSALEPRRDRRGQHVEQQAFRTVMLRGQLVAQRRPPVREIAHRDDRRQSDEAEVEEERGARATAYLDLRNIERRHGAHDAYRQDGHQKGREPPVDSRRGKTTDAMKMPTRLQAITPPELCVPPQR